MSPRRRLLRWGSWFAAANVGLLAVVGLRYLWYYSALGPSFAWLYAIVAFAGQMSLFAYVPFLVVLAPVTLLVPRRSVIGLSLMPDYRERLTVSELIDLVAYLKTRT